MRLGILISGFEKGSLKDIAGMARKIGYSDVEISACFNDRRPNIAACPRREAVETAKHIRKMGLEISSFQCHFHFGYAMGNRVAIKNPPPCAAGNKGESIEHTKKVIDLADHLGVGIVHTVSGILPELDTVQNIQYTGDIDYPARKEWRLLLDSYRVILDYAAKKKVKIAIEPVFAYIVGNYETTMRLFEDLGRDDLYLNYDPSHFPYHKESPLPLINDFGKRIIHVHVKDAGVIKLNKEDVKPGGYIYAMRSGTEAFTFAPPGKGVLDWDGIISALRKSGYEGVLSVEMGHGYPGSPEENARKCFDFFKAWINKFS
ncbi:MAG: sugar phosphate isomerase/epimerase [Kiritimatiellae bacterium]|nr:sugar phosphate isomerase/epimerase [Kiritimatiellia bacterium]